MRSRLAGPTPKVIVTQPAFPSRKKLTHCYGGSADDDGSFDKAHGVADSLPFQASMSVNIGATARIRLLGLEAVEEEGSQDGSDVAEEAAAQKSEASIA